MPPGCICRGFGLDRACKADHGSRTAVFKPAHPGPMRARLDVDQMSVDELRAEVRRLRALVGEPPK